MAKKKRAAKKAASQKSSTTRRTPRALATATGKSRLWKASAKRPAAKRHGAQPVVRSVPRRKKKVIKRVERIRSTRRQAAKKSVRVAKPITRVTRRLLSVPINASRDERTALKHALDVIRKHVRNYEAKDGYSLSDVVRFNKSRQRAILKKSQVIKELLASPHDIIRPKNDAEKRALRPFARKQMRGAKHYIVHKPDDQSRVSLRKGRVRITRQRGRVEFDSIYFMFPHAPYGEEDAVEMLEDMLPDMPTGFYIMQTGAHGDTGEPVHKDRLIEQLQNYILAYEPQQAEMVMTEVEDEEGKKTMHAGFTQAVLGYRFAGSKLDGVIIEQNKIDARRQAQREFNERLRKQRLTPAEKFEAQEKRRDKLKRRKRKAAAQKSAITRRKKGQKIGAKKAGVLRRVARPKKARRQK